MKILVQALAAVCFATVGAAQEVTGTIEGTLNGEDAVWYLTRNDGTSQSDFSGAPGFMSVSLLGHATPDTIMSTQDALMISWSKFGETIADAEIRYLPEGGFIKGFVSSPEAPVTLELTTFEVNDDVLTVSGQISATLGWSESLTQKPDMTNTVDLDLQLEGEVFQLQ